MGNTSSFKQRYKYWKETGELPYKNGIKQDLESNKVDDSPVKSSLPGYDDGRDGFTKTYVNQWGVDEEGNVRTPSGDIQNAAVVLDDVYVTPKGNYLTLPKKQDYSYTANSAYHPEDMFAYANALTGGFMLNLSPTQWLRRGYDAINGNLTTENWFGGNAGIVSNKFEEEHPYLSIGANMLGDALLLGGGSALKQFGARQALKTKRYFLPKHHDYHAYPDVNDYVKIEKDAIDRANAVANRLNTDGRWYIMANSERTPIGGEFSSTESPVSITIDGQRVAGKTKQLTYKGMGVRLNPQWGSAPNASGFPDIDIVLPDNKMLPQSFIARNGFETYFDLQNDPNFTKMIADNVAKVQNVADAPVVGSGRLISEGLFGGAPGDLEIVAPRSMIKDVQERLQFNKLRDTRNGTGVTGRSPVALEGSESNNLDINILDDTGVIIHQLESTRSPKKMPLLYSANAAKQAAQKNVKQGSLRTSSEIGIPKDDGAGNFSADEYFYKIKNNPDLLTQSVVDNTFKSGADKHVRRAIVMMNNDDPQIISRVSRAIDGMYAQIPGAKKFSELYPSQAYTDVAKNKEILQKIGFAPFDVEKFAQNPDQMKNILDYWYMRKTIGARSVNFNRSGSANYEDVMAAVRSYDNGSSAGGGGNTVLGSTFGGFTRDNTAYINYHPVVDRATATFDDVYNAFQRERDIWSNGDAVKNAIEEVAPQFGLSAKDFSRFSSWFTDDVTRLQQSGKLTPEQADRLIVNVARKLGVSGYRGDKYSNLGNYFGGMQNTVSDIGWPGAEVAYRNIDSPTHNQPILPAEWGSDNMFLNNNVFNNTNFSWPQVEHYSNIPLEEAAKKYPENIIDLLPYKKAADALTRSTKNQNHSGSYTSDILSEASGLNEARAKYDAKYDTYKRRMDRYWEIINKQSKRRRNTKQFSTIAAAFGGPLALMSYVANRNNRYYDFYEDNQKELDKIVEDEIGKYDEKRGDMDEDYADYYFEKQDRIIKREYRKYKRADRVKKMQNKLNK